MSRVDTVLVVGPAEAVETVRGDADSDVTVSTATTDDLADRLGGSVSLVVWAGARTDEAFGDAFATVEDVAPGVPVVTADAHGGVAEAVRNVIERERTSQRPGAAAELDDLTRKVADLHRVATDLQNCKSEREIYDLAVTAGEDILEFEWVVVTMLKEGWFEVTAASADAPTSVGNRHLRADEGAAGKSHQTGETLVVADAAANEDSKPIDSAMQSAVTVPIGDMGVFQGIGRETESFDEDDVRVAELLAANLREALLRVRREERLRRKREELARQNDKLEEFASVVSHDLRNPLGVAKGQIRAARSAGADSEHLELAERALSQTSDLVDDLLSLARKGEEIQEPEAVELAAVVDEAWTHQEGEATLTVAEDLGTVRCDRNRTYEVFTNLFRNAVQHAGPGVHVTVGRLPSGFYVADDGPGIPREDRETIFESGYTTSEDGTGFGLSIVSEIVSAHDWDLTVAESDAGGARFEVTGVEFE